jgi:hypothetical protein
VDVNFLAPFITTVLAQLAHKQYDHGDEDGGYIQAQQHRFPFSKTDMTTITVE